MFFFFHNNVSVCFFRLLASMIWLPIILQVLRVHVQCSVFLSFVFFFLSFLILGWFHAFASTDYLWHFYCIESFKRVRATFHTFIMTSIHNNCQFHAAYNITTAFSKSWIRCRTIRYVDWLNERCVCVLFHNFVLFLIYLVLQSFFSIDFNLTRVPVDNGRKFNDNNGRNPFFSRVQSNFCYS